MEYEIKRYWIHEGLRGLEYEEDKDGIWIKYEDFIKFMELKNG